MMARQLNRLEQLKRALEAGLIDQDTHDAAVAAFRAQVDGGGAIAQGAGATALGADSVFVKGDNEGIINLGVLVQQGSKPGANQQELTQAYLARILVEANQIPLFAGDSANAQVQLSSVYTALLTQSPDPDTATEGHVRGARRLADEPDKKLSALDSLNSQPKLVLLGGPGSGKSTFVNFVALAMAGELLGIDGPNLGSLTAPLPEERDGDEQPQPQRWDHGALLPVVVKLRDLASQLPPPPTAVTAETMWQFLCGRLKHAALEDFTPILKQHLHDHGGLVMLDGLDEVPDAFSRREQIKQAVQDFASTFYKCRFLVTSRTYAYQRQDWKLDGFLEAHLQPFTRAQIHRFVEAWYEHMVALFRLTGPDAAHRAEVLNRAVEHNERIRELAERPLLLTLIAQLQTAGAGNLPEKREELYDKAVELLLTKWETMKVRVREDGSKEVEPSLAQYLRAGRDDIRKQLNRLAFEAHRDQPKLTGTADIRQETLIAALLKASAHRDDLNVGLLERYLRDRAGILAAHGVGMYQFPHRSFQEYLAACHLTDDDFPDRVAQLARDDPNRWREVTLLAGAKAAGGSSLNAWALAETLCPMPRNEGVATADDHWGALLAGRVLVECADLASVATRDKPKLSRVREWQLTIMRGDALPATERALAGRSLALLGDPRPEVATLDGMQFCLVPAGSYVMGDDAGASDENPQHSVDLDYPYFIARFPVTVAQWREYAGLSGRSVTDDRSLNGRMNDPAVHVRWHDARRFCEFLTTAWRGILPKGYVATLPSEAEWEKAARGGERVPEEMVWVTPQEICERLAAMARGAEVRNPCPARTYAWGDDFEAENANTDFAIGNASAVGCYSKGRTPYGCEEMCGNVWEWTRSLWGSDLFKSGFAYPYDSTDASREALDAGDDILRVVRGGSWFFHRDFARCAYRYRFLPVNRGRSLGFRVVLRSAPDS